MVYIVGQYAERISLPEIGTAWCGKGNGKDRQRAVDDLVVAKVLDDTTGMRNGGAVAPEELPHLRERETKCHVREIHCHLAAEGNRCGTASRAKRERRNSEHRKHTVFD